MARMAVLLALALPVAVVSTAAASAQRADRAAIEVGLDIRQPGSGSAKRLDLAAALEVLRIPSVSVALIDGEQVAWAHAWGGARHSLSGGLALEAGDRHCSLAAGRHGAVKPRSQRQR